MVTLIALAGCGKSGSSKTTTTAGAGCGPVKGNQLVLLEDDKHLQQAENILPAVNSAKAASSPALIAALNKVSTVLDTATLIGLNKQTDIDRVTPFNAAKGFVDKNKLTDGLTKGSGSVSVGTQGFSESQTMGQIYVAVLKAAGFSASTKTVGARVSYQPSLGKGGEGIDVVPEYLGSLTEYYNHRDNGAAAKPVASGDVGKTLATLKTLAAKHGVTVGDPAKAQDQNAFAVTKGFADKHKIKTLSALAAACPDGVVLGGPPECTSPNQPQCALGLRNTYGIKYTKFVPSGAAGSTTVKTFTKTGRVTLGLVLSSDGTLQPA